MSRDGLRIITLWPLKRVLVVDLAVLASSSCSGAQKSDASAEQDGSSPQAEKDAGPKNVSPTDMQMQRGRQMRLPAQTRTHAPDVRQRSPALSTVRPSPFEPPALVDPVPADREDEVPR
jgi:hypothetical protein